MIDAYPGIRQLHVVSAVASGGLFLVRGLAVQLRRPDWALAPAPRYLSYAVDTTLLAAALALVAILPASAFGNGWLAAKLAILPAYIALGWLALRSGTAQRRLAAFLAALAAFGCMFAIARAHDPLGPLRAWTGG
jgi:uncharacterized membrane protein SirB2